MNGFSKICLITVSVLPAHSRGKGIHAVRSLKKRVDVFISMHDKTRNAYYSIYHQQWVDTTPT